MFLTPYHTTAGKGMLNEANKIVNIIKSVIGYNEGIVTIYPGTNNDGCIKAICHSDYTKKIPDFFHPIAVKDGSEYDVWIDAKPFSNPRQNSWDKIDFKNMTDNYFAITKAKLTHYWLNININDIRTFSPLPAAIYATYVSETLARKFSLNIEQQLRLAVHAGFFYFNLFFTDDEIKHKLQNKPEEFVAFVLKSNKMLNEKIVIEVLEIYQEEDLAIDSIDRFCSLCEKITGSVVFTDFTQTAYYAILNGGWFGLGARESVAIALEYPPIWVTIISLALNERTYRNSPIAKIVERSYYRDLTDSFQRQISGLIGYYESKN